ncbi:MAG: hypothetical protein A3E87_05670 [Gammaproteobacteria bacterium RIFCSPHIGHO2_12_FULL_35_23]|nr:MAG: hypothetical protein A3E87_05670 [Gammaproteobacteria bacterium RIFCSPHIGHO2_12_FULL_35_23]
MKELLSKVFVSHLINNLANTIISGIVLTICSLLIYIFFASKYDYKKQRVKFKYRLIYVAVFIFILVLAKIWVEGFAHIFTVLGLVAAGLVVTNKETIMNLVGWLIINWRGLFNKGDFIQIQAFSGYVDTVGLLYFKIYEVSALNVKRATGKTIKIPNGLVLTNAITSLSPNTNLCEYTVKCHISLESNLEETVSFVKETINNIIKKFYDNHENYQREYIEARNKTLAKILPLENQVLIEPVFDKKNDIKLLISFYCYPPDYIAIEQKFWQEILSGHRTGKINLTQT